MAKHPIMLQIIVLLAISWLVVYIYNKGNLSVLGFTPTRDRISLFIQLFLASSLASTTSFLLKMYIAKEEYVLVESLTAYTIMKESWYQLRSVLTEELLCRGVLLFILIKTLGKTKAVVLSSLLFASLHFLNPGVWGDLVQMTLIFMFTFSMGLLLAYSYIRTGSLIPAVGIHFGWNITQNLIFPDSASGNHIFALGSPPPEVTVSYFAFFTMLLLPKFLVLGVNFFIIKNHGNVDTI